MLISEMRTVSTASPFVTVDLVSRESAFRYGVPEVKVPEGRPTPKIEVQAMRGAGEEHPPDRAMPPHAEPKAEGRRATPEVIRIGGIRMPQRASGQAFDFDAMSADLIEDKVGVVARKTVTLLVDSAKNELTAQAKEVQRAMDEMISRVDGKIDREFVERMFNKFRVMLNDMNDKIANIQCSFLEWVTRDELELVLNRFLGVVKEVNDAAGTKVKYNCLLCGRPRAHLAGMSFTDALPDEENEETKVRPKKRYIVLENGRMEKTADGKARAPRDVVQFITSS
jgi:hypothetical protein